MRRRYETGKRGFEVFKADKYANEDMVVKNPFLNRMSYIAHIFIPIILVIALYVAIDCSDVIDKFIKDYTNSLLTPYLIIISHYINNFYFNRNKANHNGKQSTRWGKHFVNLLIIAVSAYFTWYFVFGTSALNKDHWINRLEFVSGLAYIVIVFFSYYSCAHMIVNIIHSQCKIIKEIDTANQCFNVYHYDKRFGFSLQLRRISFNMLIGISAIIGVAIVLIMDSENNGLLKNVRLASLLVGACAAFIAFVTTPYFSLKRAIAQKKTDELGQLQLKVNCLRDAERMRDEFEWLFGIGKFRFANFAEVFVAVIGLVPPIATLILTLVGVF